MNIDYEAGGFWAMIALYIYNISQSVYLLFNRRSKAVQIKISAVETDLSSRIDDVDGEVRRISLDIARLPDQRQIEKLNGSITELSGQISKFEGRFEGVNRAVDIINEFLINQGGKSGP